MYCCAWCQHFRNTEKEGSDGYCFVDGTDVRLEDVCDEFEKQEVKEGKGGNKMTNREWLNSLSDEELAILCNDSCQMCASQECYGEKSCVDGVTEWLKKKHIVPMPELEAGDIVKTHYAEYVAIGGAVIVNPITSVRKFLGELDGHIRFIYRFNGAEKEYEEIWRDDDK